MSMNYVISLGLIGLLTVGCQKDKAPVLNLNEPGLIEGRNQGVGAVDVTTGLVAFYPFSGNANDGSGNLNNGVVAGAQLTTDRIGKRNRAYNFQNGATITIPHKPYLGFSYNSDFTVCIWAFKTGTQNVMHLLGKRPQRSATFNWQVACVVPSINTSDRGVSFGFGNNAYFGVFSEQDLSPKWTHVVGMFSKGVWQLYIDGILSDTYTSSLVDADTDCSLTIGNSGGYEPFLGSLDEIRIYNRKLTPDQIVFLAKH